MAPDRKGKEDGRLTSMFLGRKTGLKPSLVIKLVMTTRGRDESLSCISIYPFLNTTLDECHNLMRVNDHE